MQEQPADGEMQKDRSVGRKGKEVYGVRLGAKDRSFLVRDKQIEVLKNVYGGVEVNFSFYSVPLTHGAFGYVPGTWLLKLIESFSPGTIAAVPLRACCISPS